MWKLVVRVYRRHFKGDNVSHIETLYVNGTQLDNWLKRGNDEFVEIISYSRC